MKNPIYGPKHLPDVGRILPIMVSVIICTYNRKEMLDLCLQSVLSQDYEDMEIIVIDDNSADGTSDFIRTNYPSIKLITNAENKGPAYAKNQGIRASQGKFILFLDNDVELINKNAVSIMVDLLLSDKTIGEVGGEILDYSDKENYPVIGNQIADDAWPRAISASKNEVEKLKECDYLATANCMVRREVICVVGGFDPFYFYPAEDKDLGYRIKKAGFRNVIYFDAGALHKRSQQSRIHSYYMAKRATVRFIIKEYGFGRFLAMELKRYFAMFSRQKAHHNDIGGVADNGSIVVSFPYLLALAKAYFWNLLYLPRTINAKGKNFLATAQMKRYKKPRLL